MPWEEETKSKGASTELRSESRASQRPAHVISGCGMDKRDVVVFSPATRDPKQVPKYPRDDCTVS